MRHAPYGERWRELGQAEYVGEANAQNVSPDDADGALDADCRAVGADVSGSVWKLLVAPGERVTEGQDLAILESMKMEVSVSALADGVIESLACAEGDAVTAGQRLMVIRVDADSANAGSPATDPTLDTRGEEAACQ